MSSKIPSSFQSGILLSRFLRSIPVDHAFLFIVTSIVLLSVCFSMPSIHAQSLSSPIPINNNVVGFPEARNLGPATCSGRITALEAVYIPVDKSKVDKRLTIFVGTAAGGVWKSQDNGTSFKSLMDKQPVQSVGCMALDPNHRDSVLWVGTGECNVRNSVSIGAGLYKTLDGGETWSRLGLEKCERIAKIALNPKDASIALVAGMGALWSDSEERGLYRTSDGGKTFERVLYVDDKTGCCDVAIDPSNPNICYAAMWQFRRTAWSFSSGGSGSGLYKSVDAGKTWKKLEKSLPDGDFGRILLAIAPSKNNVVYAMVESKESGVYRSEDRGESWTKQSNAISVTARPFYFSCLYVDPFNENRVYRPSFQLGISDDGGKTFNGFSYGGGVHPDMHALWIDPTNPQHLLMGTDGGVYRSYDRGITWGQFRNLPLGQFYRITYDMDDPYRAYGGLQDNGSWMVPSRSPSGISNKSWDATGWGDGFAVFRDHSNPDLIYFESQGGEAVRRHVKSGQIKPIKPFEEPGQMKLRFNWNTPLMASNANPKRIYIASQFCYTSTDNGDNWIRISDDLTTNDSAKYNPVNSGGVTKDNTSAENHCTIYSVQDSPLDENLLWVGTDDGNIQLTSDLGKNWRNVSANLPPAIPKNSMVSSIEPSHFDKNIVFATLDNHTRGDFKPYVVRSTDAGATWSMIVTDSIRGFAHVVREDLKNRNLLFVGTEYGLFVTLDGGQNWCQYTANNTFPSTPVRDIAIHPRENDVILGTHGRGLWIIDDITPWRAITPEVLKNELTVLYSKPGVFKSQVGFQFFDGADEYSAGNPTNDATLYYFMKSKHLMGDFKAEVVGEDGAVITTLATGKRKGLNTLTWGMNMKPPKIAISENTSGSANYGPQVKPGTYSIRLVKNEKTFQAKLDVRDDPTSIHTAEDRSVRFASVAKCYALHGRLAYSADVAVAIRKAIDSSISRISETEKKKVEAMRDSVNAAYKEMVADKSALFADTEDKLREKLDDIYGSVQSYPGRPSTLQLQRIADMTKSIEMLENKVEMWKSSFILELNKIFQGISLPPVQLPSLEEFLKKES